MNTIIQKKNNDYKIQIDYHFGMTCDMKSRKFVLFISPPLHFYQISK